MQRRTFPSLINFSVQCLLFLLALDVVWIFDARADDSTKVRIGVISALTGACGEVCVGAAQTIQLACEEWNASRTPKVDCLIEDDGTDPKKGLSAFLDLRDRKQIKGLINVASGTIAAIASEVRKHELPTVQVFLEGEDPVSDSIFQICPEMMVAEEGLGREVAKRFPGDIVVFHSSMRAITRLVDAFERGAGRTLNRVEFPINAADVRSSVLKALHQKPAVLVFVTTPEHTVLIEKDLRAFKSTIPRVFDANFSSALSEVRKSIPDLSPLHDSLVLNMLMAESTEKEEFKVRYIKRFGTPPAPYWEYGYDAFSVLMKAYSPDSKQWVKNMQNSQFEGFSGRMEFSPEGTTSPAYEIITVGELMNRTATFF